jgi:4-carboxymuconolactone decarboxylase
MVAHATANPEVEADLAFPSGYNGVYGQRRRKAGLALYKALDISRDDHERRNSQSAENFRFLDAPHVAIVTNPRALGVYAAVDAGGFIASFLLSAQAHGVCHHTPGCACPACRFCATLPGYWRRPADGLWHLFRLRANRSPREPLPHVASVGGRMGAICLRQAMQSQDNPTPAQLLLGDIAPVLADLTNDVLFGQIWEHTQLSKRDRSLITCAALVVTGKTEQMGGHFPRALANCVSRTELIELITHLAFYGGWPNALLAALRAKEVLGADGADGADGAV